MTIINLQQGATRGVVFDIKAGVGGRGVGPPVRDGGTSQWRGPVADFRPAVKRGREKGGTPPELPPYTLLILNPGRGWPEM